MDWSAKLLSVTEGNNKLQATLTIEFTDGSNRIVLDFITSDLSIEGVKRIARNQVNQYNTVAAFIANPPIGPLDLFIPVAVVEEDLYQSKRAELVAAKQNLELGLVTIDQYNAKLSEVTSIVAKNGILLL